MRNKQFGKTKKILVLVLMLCLFVTYMPVSYATDITSDASANVISEGANSSSTISADTGNISNDATSDASANVYILSSDASGDTVAETEEAKLYEKSKVDELAYNPLFIINHINKKYINVNEIDMGVFYTPVTVARGVATYNAHTQSDFDVTEDNYYAGLAYQIPIYDVDSKSNYYVAIPNVNMYNSNFDAYDLMLTYNNEGGETISGWNYDGYLLYIPKNSVKHPSSETFRIYKTHDY